MLGKILVNYSPNFTTSKRNTKNIKYLVFHYTGMSRESEAINRLINQSSKVSCHYYIKRNGQIILMVPETYIAWHAGRSNWNKNSNLNKYSIGIEISNKGHQFGYEKFSKLQISSIIHVSRYLIKKYKIKKKNVLGHSDIAFDRKKDPGEKFPWEFLAKKGVGIWHKINCEKLKKFRKKKIHKTEEKKMINFLKKIGYYTKNLSKINLVKLVKSFQRRFRPELINGKIDKECLVIAQKLSKLYS